MANYFIKKHNDEHGFGYQIHFPASDELYSGSVRILSTYGEEVTMGLLYAITQGYFKEDENGVLSSSEGVSDRKD